MDLVEELEKVARAEAGDLLMDATLESHAEGILTQWKKTERDARHNLDDAFFEKVARAIRSLKSLETEVTANSPPSQFAVVAALQATKIISNQNALPSWEYIHLRTELVLAGRYAYLNSGGGAAAERFKALALQELNLFRQRSKNKEVKWNSIRREIGLQDLLRDRLTLRERKELKALKAKMLP